MLCGTLVTTMCVCVYVSLIKHIHSLTFLNALSVAQMCVEHDNTRTAALDGKHSLEETNVLFVSVKVLFIYSISLK